MTIQNMMSEVESPERTRIQADAANNARVLGSWVSACGRNGRSNLLVRFSIAQDTRAELRRRSDVTLTFAEEIGVGSFRYLRKIVDRVDRIVGEGLGRSEATALVVTRTLRKTGHGVADLASTALTDTIGSSPLPAKGGRLAERCSLREEELVGRGEADDAAESLRGGARCPSG